jgi:hypothetical protein
MHSLSNGPRRGAAIERRALVPLRGELSRIDGWREPADARVGPNIVCSLVASLQARNDVNSVSFRNSSRKRPLKLSTKAFCIGFPGAM